MVRILGRYVPVKIFILAITESALVVLSIGVALWIRFGNPTDAIWYLSRSYTAAQVGVIVLVSWVCLYYNDMYDLQAVARRSELIVHLMQALGMAGLILALLYYLVPD